tara:strand:- start:9956 stop:10381 length:426 start_codon:yes stop_codon:yes gene_type:complete
MEYKKCGKCNLSYPKTKEFFYIKKIKQENAKGELKIYNSFRSFCKSCLIKTGELNRIKKRCIELECDISEYRQKWKDQYSKTRTKIKLKSDKDTVSKFHSRNLTDYYISNLLRKNKNSIPKGMIETKRLIIKLKRELKNGS